MLHLPHRCAFHSAILWLLILWTFSFLSSLFHLLLWPLITVHDPLPAGVKCTKEKACPRCFQLGHKVPAYSPLSLWSDFNTRSPSSFSFYHLHKNQLKECTNTLPEGKRCVICGEKGHDSSECKVSLDEISKCPICNGVHGIKECKASINIYPCTRCGSYEHRTADCPEEAKKFCSFCGKDDHFSSECKNKPEPIKRVIHCAICHSTEHLAKDCPMDKMDDELLETPKREEEKPAEPQKKQSKKLDLTESEFPALAN